MSLPHVQKDRQIDADINDELYHVYRTVFDQGFIPIFTGGDPFEPRKLVEACVEAGYKGIEVTLRQPEARKLIPWVRETYPDLYVLVGSTLDNDAIVKHMRRKNPQLMTLDEIADLDVHGFVSMVGWSLESIQRFSATHIVIPTASTVTEAFRQVGAGAHFIKLFGNKIDLVKECRGAAQFGYCPIMVTGGMTTERIPEAVQAGAVLIGSGFDLILKDESTDFQIEKITKVLKNYSQAVQRARDETWPQLAAVRSADRQDWLDALPHFHAF